MVVLSHRKPIFPLFISLHFNTLTDVAFVSLLLLASLQLHCARYQWTGNCIAKRNYKFFLRFLASVTIFVNTVLGLCIYILAKTTRYNVHIRHLSLAASIECAIISSPVTTFIGSLTLICAWSLLSLLLYHFYLMTIGQTTNEHVRDYLGPGVMNPFHHGCCGNCAEICCSESTPSLLNNLSDEITAEEYILKTLA